MRVLEIIEDLFSEKYGCLPEDVTMEATLDDLNVTVYEREDMALTLEEYFGVGIDDAALNGFETVEDVVGYIEDALNEQEAAV